MVLPADSHVHTEWSWDTDKGSMVRTCEEAVRVGLPVVAFTEHLDHTVWRIGDERVHPHHRHLVQHGRLAPPALDIAGYLACVEDCRERFPSLRILTGVELGEPHWYPGQVAESLAGNPFERILGSQHSLPVGDGEFSEPPEVWSTRPPRQVVCEYLAEVDRLVESDAPFEILTHVDYPLRSWPRWAGPFDVTTVEEEFRHTLRLLAASGRALEYSTRLPMEPAILRWWHEVGGDAISFGSDAHRPSLVARGFTDAVELAEASGFRPGSRPYELWGRA